MKGQLVFESLPGVETSSVAVIALEMETDARGHPSGLGQMLRAALSGLKAIAHRALWLGSQQAGSARGSEQGRESMVVGERKLLRL